MVGLTFKSCMWGLLGVLDDMGCAYSDTQEMTHRVHGAQSVLLVMIGMCWGVRVCARIKVWLGSWLHLVLSVGFFGLLISCIGNLECVNYLSSLVLSFEFDLIFWPILGFLVNFGLLTAILIYKDFIWLPVSFNIRQRQRELSNGLHMSWDP